MSRKLTKYEQETTKNFNKADNVAYIFTHGKRWQQHIEEKLGIKPTDDNGFGGKNYEVNKSPKSSTIYRERRQLVPAFSPLHLQIWQAVINSGGTML